MANSHSIHLVRSSQPSPKPNLDPADIAAAVLETVRDCTKALHDAENYTEWALGQCRGQLSLLELAAMRAMARRRS
jgi:hypothetical protein